MGSQTDNRQCDLDERYKGIYGEGKKMVGL